ncbi:MAG: FTR1 family protein [Lonepinella koalarum]|nr:FTR1 family protein [Lonepinella koalarum]
MKMITWAKLYLNSFKLFFVLILLNFPVSAKVEMGHLFVHLSDAMGEIKQGKPESAVNFLTVLEADLYTLPHESEAGKTLTSALQQAKNTPNNDNIEQLSKALLAFEKEQNPVDYVAKRVQFTKRIMPVYQKLAQAVANQNLEEAQTAYKSFNTAWTLNEKAVRDTSLGHYGQIETAMTLLRSAMLSEPANFNEIQKQADLLGLALVDFNAGNTAQVQTSNKNAPQTLPEGIALLEQAYGSMRAGELEKVRSQITLFIQQWAVFEGDVRTRDGTLYSRVESDLPLMMAKAGDPQNTQQFHQLIQDLKALNVAGSYGVIDAMLILLREGLEALLIIIALLTTLKATRQPKAQGWVYGGAGLGIAASLLGAIALQQLFPAVSAGKNREILESAVGIFAVLMMLLVGAWLHSKSSLQGWQKFVNKQLGNAVATGSLFSIMLLSFLSVFREGAETVLFYAGMLPQISTQDFLLGISLALAILALVALLMTKTSAKLPIHHLFKIMTWLIYGLGFKILGVSINTLQLTQMLPRHLYESIPNLPWIGFYSSWEGIAAQGGYLLLIPIVRKCFR